MRLSKSVRVLAASLFALAVILVAAPVGAEPIPLEFAYGGSDAALVSNYVDAYDGFGGTAPTTPCYGWGGRWRKSTTNGAYTETVMNGSPLYAGGGNYLHSSLLTTAAAGKGCVARYYAYNATNNPDGIVLTTDHSVSFKYRIDDSLSTFTASNDYYGIFDAASLSNSTGAIRWYVYGRDAINPLDDPLNPVLPRVPGNWTAYYGDYAGNSVVQVDTGIPLVQGVTYDFKITLRSDPDPIPEDPTSIHMRWDLRLSNGVTTFDSTTLYPNGMGWRFNSNLPQTPMGYLNFFSQASAAGETRKFSIDAIHIPEPSTVVLLGFGLLGLVACAWRKR